MQHEGSSFYMTHFKRIVINDLLSNVALSAFNIYTIWYLANVVHSRVQSPCSDARDLSR